MGYQSPLPDPVISSHYLDRLLNIQLRFETYMTHLNYFIAPWSVYHVNHQRFDEKRIIKYIWTNLYWIFNWIQLRYEWTHWRNYHLQNSAPIKVEYHTDAKYENPLKKSETIACVGQRLLYPIMGKQIIPYYASLF